MTSKIESKEPVLKGSKNNKKPQRVKWEQLSVEHIQVLSVIRLLSQANEVKTVWKDQKEGPVELGRLPITTTYTLTEEARLVVGSLRAMLGQGTYPFMIRTVLNASSSGTGILNATISNATLASNPDIVSLQSVFQEAFVLRMDVKWVPVSRYQYPLGGTSTLSVANLPLGVAGLHHSAGAYSSLAAMSQNYAFNLNSTGDPFTATWKNSEKPASGVVVDSGSSSALPCQGWCNAFLLANYTGFLQFLTQSAPPALPFSQVLGTFVVSWSMLFRLRE